MTVLLPHGVRPGGRFDRWRPPHPRYVVCDVDGTLVGPDAAATARVAAAVRDAQRQGLRVGVATGRMRGAVQALHDQLGLDGPHVLHNGAEVRLEGRTVASWPLGADDVDRLLAAAGEADDLYLEVYPEEGFWVSSPDPRARDHWRILGGPPAGVVQAGADVPGPIRKATFALFDPSLVDQVVATVEGLGLAAGPAGSPRTPQLTYVNATHPDADKGTALTRAAAEVGIDLAEVVAVGDATNDLPMFAVAGTAIAMGQAPERVQAAAHLVVDEVDDDGAAVALEACTGWARTTP